MKSKSVVLNTGKIENLVHISGSRGLVKDQANGVFSNTVLAGTVTDYLGGSIATLANEIRVTNARRIENINPVACNVKFGNAAETTPAPTNGVALTNAPYGFTTGWQYSAGCTGNSQRNLTIPASTDTYLWSVIVYKTGAGAKFQTGSLGINGVSICNGYYDFDTQARTLPNDFIIEDLGNNYYRLSYPFPNNGAGTLFIFYMSGSVSGMEKLIFTGHQLVRVPAATVYRRRTETVSKGILSSPYHGYGVDAVRYFDTKPPPYTQIHAWGDSISIAGTSNTWLLQFRKIYGAAAVDGVSSETSTQIRTRFEAGSTHATDIVIIEAGRNNYTSVSTVLADIAAMVALIPHDRYIICNILNRAFDEYLGTSAYNDVQTMNAALLAAYPNNYVDIMQALLDAHNPNDSAEAAAYAIHTTTARLQGDGLHPTDAGQIAITAALWNFIVTKGWLNGVEIGGQYGILHSGDALKLPYSANVNFRHDKGIVLLKVKMKQANSATNKALFAANTGATDFIYDNGAGGIALGDGTNTATASVGGWTTDDILLIGACYDDKAGKMSVHVSKNGGAWIDSADTTYDGAFPAGSNLVWCSSNTDTVEIMSTKVFRSTKGFYKMQNWIKNRAASEAV